MSDYKKLLGDIADCLITHPSEKILKTTLHRAYDAIEELAIYTKMFSLKFADAKRYAKICETECADAERYAKQCLKERDAAIHDLEMAVCGQESYPCRYCANYGIKPVDVKDACKNCVDCDKWEWRGVE